MNFSPEQLKTYQAFVAAHQGNYDPNSEDHRTRLWALMEKIDPALWTAETWAQQWAESNAAPDPKDPKRKLSADEDAAFATFKSTHPDYIPESSAHKKHLREAMRKYTRPWTDPEVWARAWAEAKENLKKEVSQSTKTIHIGQGKKKKYQEEEETSCELIVRRGSEVTLRRVRWLWKPLLPFMEISVFAGMPDGGKGSTTADITARITARLPFFEQDTYSLGDRDEVLILSGEESYDTTTLPRIAAAGGNLEKVHIIEGVKVTALKSMSHSERTLALLSDVELIGRYLAQNPRIVLVVIDPVDVYFGGAKKNASEDVTTIYGALKGLADRYNVALLLIDHLNKDSEKAALHRISGAGAAGARPRSAWLFAKDKDNKENPKLRHIVNLKGNLLSEEEKQGFKFEVIGKTIKIEDQDESVACVNWLGRSDADADSLLAKRDPELTEIKRAKKWLLQFLAKGKKLAKEAYTAGEAEGISEKTLRRACELVCRKPFRPKIPGPWYWELKPGAKVQAKAEAPPPTEAEVKAAEAKAAKRKAARDKKAAAKAAEAAELRDKVAKDYGVASAASANAERSLSVIMPDELPPEAESPF